MHTTTARSHDIAQTNPSFRPNVPLSSVLLPLYSALLRRRPQQGQREPGTTSNTGLVEDTSN